jgi:hypothetical protein
VENQLAATGGCINVSCDASKADVSLLKGSDYFYQMLE